VIVSINQRQTVSVADAVAAISAAKAAGRGTVLLFVQRGASPPRYIGVKIASK
jgi:serine protease Do